MTGKKCATLKNLFWLYQCDGRSNMLISRVILYLATLIFPPFCIVEYRISWFMNLLTQNYGIFGLFYLPKLISHKITKEFWFDEIFLTAPHCRNLAIFLPFKFYVKPILAVLKRSKTAISAIMEALKLDLWEFYTWKR